MAGNQLTGGLPSSFAQLVNLERIWLGSNRLLGTLPDKIFDKWAKKLQVLDLSKNSFRGSIPKHLFSKSKNLKLLYLEDNQLSGTLPENSPASSSGSSGTVSSASTSSALEVLDVGNNQLTGTIPTSWIRLSKLRDLNLAGNRFSGTLPLQILRLTKLEVLVLVRLPCVVLFYRCLSVKPEKLAAGKGRFEAVLKILGIVYSSILRSVGTT